MPNFLVSHIVDLKSEYSWEQTCKACYP